MLAKGYTELSGLFRILQNDAIALFTLLLCAWTAGYRIDLHGVQLPVVSLAPNSENLKVFDDLGGLAVAAFLVSLVVFVIQGVLGLGSFLPQLVDRVFPMHVRPGIHYPLNDRAMAYIAAAIPENERVPERLSTAYFYFRNQDGITRPAFDADGYHKTLQERFSFYYALQGKMMLFCCAMIVLRYVRIPVPSQLTEGHSVRLFELLVAVALGAFIIRRRLGRNLSRWQEQLFSSALEQSKLWEEPIKKTATEWPKPFEAGLAAIDYYRTQQEQRIVSLWELVIHKLSGLLSAQSGRLVGRGIVAMHNRMLSAGMHFQSGPDESIILGYFGYRYLLLNARIMGRIEMPRSASNESEGPIQDRPLDRGPTGRD